MKAIYPFVGSSENSCKFNLKNPQDLDSAFRLKFFGGWTHSTSGSLPNGTDGYAETYLNVDSALTPNSHAITFYINSDPSGNPGDVRMTMGAYSASNGLTSYHQLTNKYFQSGPNVSVSNTPGTKGFFGLSRNNNASEYYIVKSDGTYQTQFLSTYTSINRTIYIGKVNGLLNPTDNQSIAFISISEGLTQQEMTDLRTAVIEFQTTLGRNI